MMAWTRRRFLGLAAGAAALAAVRPRAAGAAAGGDAQTIAALRALVRQRAIASGDPWVSMHVVLALGADVQGAGGPILDAVVARYATRTPKGGREWVGFPIHVEAHPNHFLEIMDAVGVPPARRFAAAGGAIGVDDLLAGAKALFSPTIAGPELSWTLSVFTAAMPPSADRFVNADGQTFTVAALVETAAQAAELGFADTVAAMRGAKAYGRSVLQTYACNGSHVLYGLYDALRHGYEAKGLRQRVRDLTRAAYFRLGAEVALIDQALASPAQQLNADAAKLQFLGHSIENLRYAERWGIYAPSAGERAACAAAERTLAEVVQRITSVHNLDALAASVPRAYRILLGDACHALHGLTSEAA
ncbi:MAG: hypothetical protein B6D46_12015 [Polyangiaceae bacterium UTPRO1]|jgi:hypothetical protein|nr:MAG: hypothetical protein B6D46_12015 [Polyangiaceae bacterium UTPRO1]